MNNQFNNRSYNSITKQQQKTLTLSQALKLYPFFWNNMEVVGHSSSMQLTDKAFIQMRVTFCEYLVS